MADKELARELGGIESACADKPSPCGPGMCVYRVVHGLSESAWEELKRSFGLDAWRAAAADELPPPGGTSGLRLFLAREMDRAKLCQQPLALALIAPEADSADRHIHELVSAQLRSFDFSTRLDGGAVAVILSGTALAAAERVIGAMLRRIRQVLDPDPVCSVGLVGYGGLAQVDADALLDNAGKALEAARRLGGNRLEVAPSADAALASRETLVRASEKHFLFTGKKLAEPQDKP